MSGTATLTQKFVEAVASRAIILDTRKTTPTLRVLEKYAVRAGGGVNHRLALDDGVLIKDNHIQLVGSVAEALRRVRAVGGNIPLEVEAQSLKEVDEAVAAGADIVLVDNLSTDDVREAVKRVGERAKIEVSGGITLDRASELASTGVTYISVGALTHSAPAVDCSFDLCSESE
jgi:nicotinate-nucleotide pyrophosphorylase (carboxylating)